MLDLARSLLKTSLRSAVDDTEMIELTARGLWKACSALKKAGFRHDEAMEILKHQGLKFFGVLGD